MTRDSILLIGCGQMGRGIARMLLLEQRRQLAPFDLWVFDPFPEAEEQCQLEIRENRIQGSIRLLREWFSKADIIQVTNLQNIGDENDIDKTQAVIARASEQIQPRLILNAATYLAQRMYIPLALELGCDYIDLGQNLPPIQELNVLDAKIAQNQKGSRIIQESGLAPGLANILAVSMYELARKDASEKRIHTVQMRVGGLPQHTRKGGALHYGPTFSPAGLSFEYEKPAYNLRNGQLVSSTTFTHSEYWESPFDQPLSFGIMPFTITDPALQSILITRVQDEFLEWHRDQLLLKNLEARHTADGTSRMCFDQSFQATVMHLEYKTLRYFPHYETWNELQRQGRYSSTLANWKHHMNDPEVSGNPDLVLLRIWAQATTTSQPHVVELIALHDEVSMGEPTGFTAMQHLTGWPTVLLALLLLQYPALEHSPYPEKYFRSPSFKTAFGRTIQEALYHGGILAPFELIKGLPLLEEITKRDRIALCQTTVV